MKLITISLFIILLGAADISQIIILHPWKVESIKLVTGTQNPLDDSHVTSFENKPPLCGQIIFFREDHTIVVKNKGKGGLSDLDNYTWSVDKNGNMLFWDSKFDSKFYLSVLSSSNDSLVLYIPGTGIENGIKSFTIYTLKNINIK